MSNKKDVSEYNEKELLQRIAMWTKKTSDNTSTIKNILLVYFILSIIGIVLAFLGLFG